MNIMASVSLTRMFPSSGAAQKHNTHRPRSQIRVKTADCSFEASASLLPSFSSSPVHLKLLQKSVPLAATLAILLSSNPANAGFLSGSTGIESIPGPQLPQLDFLSRFNEENQKKYAENDARFKSTPLVKQLLERSKLNKEKNRQEILDKYCIRGAEWGVGDCSAEGMSVDDKEKFIAMLKQKAGIKD